MRRVLGSQAALSGMLGGELGVAVGRERRHVRGSRLGGPLIQFTWLTWISKNF